MAKWPNANLFASWVFSISDPATALALLLEAAQECGVPSKTPAELFSGGFRVSTINRLRRCRRRLAQIQPRQFSSGEYRIRTSDAVGQFVGVASTDQSVDLQGLLHDPG